MAEEKQKGDRKTETLTVRISPQTKFLIEFLGRLLGQSLTTVVERALAEAAQRATFMAKNGTQRHWSDFWYDSEAARELQMAGEPNLHSPYSHRKRREFAEQLWPFFFKDKNCVDVNEAYATVLYPVIDEFKYIYEEKHSLEDAGRAMAKYLQDAGLDPPDHAFWSAAVRARALVYGADVVSELSHLVDMAERDLRPKK